MRHGEERGRLTHLLEYVEVVLILDPRRHERVLRQLYGARALVRVVVEQFRDDCA